MSGFPSLAACSLGDDVQKAETPTGGHFPDSQDQRNTLFTRWVYQVKPRFWVAGGIQYGSGLPFEFDGDYQTALEEYGPQVLSRVNFARGRIDPSLIVSASAGADVYKTDKMDMRLQVDGQNLTNVLNVIDFGGLFSGNAIGPARSAFSAAHHDLLEVCSSTGKQSEVDVQQRRPLLSVGRDCCQS